jgi:hypothetical protein
MTSDDISIKFLRVANLSVLITALSIFLFSIARYHKTVVCADRSKLCVRKKVEISVDVTTSRVMGNCNSITEITEGKIYSNCQNLNV